MDILVVFLLILGLNWLFIKLLDNRFNLVSTNYLWLLFAVHGLLTAVYMLYAAATASDSVAYFYRTSAQEDWLPLLETGTSFIHFLVWPLIHVFDLSYYANMLVFSFIGYVAVVFLYLATTENMLLKPIWNNYSYAELLFLLPNLHFWSASLGKGSTILLGIAWFVFGLSRFNRRLLLMVVGGLLVYMVRPHILFTLILSVMLGVLLTSSGIKGYLRVLVFLLAAGVFYFISESVVKFTDTDSLNVLTSSSISHKAAELGKASSGVNLAEYNLFMKLFTFWFRPLFVDSGGFIGIFASFENVLYLYMTWAVVRRFFTHWLDWNGWFRICFFFFILGSFILAQVSGNLGIAMRQKAQMMPFLFILFCKSNSISATEEEDF